MKKRSALSKPIFILLGLALFLLFSLPFLFFREQIQQMAALGYAGLFAACALSNASVFLPSSSAMFVILAAGALNPALCVLIGGLGTAVGEQCSYLLGRAGASAFNHKETKTLSRVHRFVRRHDFLAVFLFALVPLPIFDLASVAAGADRMPWPKYALAAFLGKTLRFAVSVWIVMSVFPAMAKMDGPTGDILRAFLSVANPQ